MCTGILRGKPKHIFKSPEIRMNAVARHLPLSCASILIHSKSFCHHLLRTLKDDSIGWRNKPPENSACTHNDSVATGDGVWRNWKQLFSFQVILNSVRTVSFRQERWANHQEETSRQWFYKQFAFTSRLCGYCTLSDCLVSAHERFQSRGSDISAPSKQFKCWL